MEEKGIFRSALGGFNKQDVLAYIDRITADWDAERRQLTEQAQADSAAAAQAQQKAQAAQQAAQEAMQAAAEALAQQKAAEETAQQLAQEAESARQQAEADRRDAQAQIAALQAQIAEQEEKAHAAIAEMMAAEERLSTREQELAERDARLSELEAQQSHYRAILGDSDTMQQKMTDTALPCMRQIGGQADTTLDAVGQALTAIADRIAELQGQVDSSRTLLQQAQADSEQQLHDSAAQWIEQAHRLSGQSDDRFFR